jgi:hypothetical protein
MNVKDTRHYLHLIVVGLEARGFDTLRAVRRARDFVQREGADLPAADVVEEIARQEARL